MVNRNLSVNLNRNRSSLSVNRNRNRSSLSVNLNRNRNSLSVNGNGSSNRFAPLNRRTLHDEAPPEPVGVNDLSANALVNPNVEAEAPLMNRKKRQRIAMKNRMKERKRNAQRLVIRSLKKLLRTKKKHRRYLRHGPLRRAVATRITVDYGEGIPVVVHLIEHDLGASDSDFDEYDA